MSQPLLQAEDIGKDFGGLRALDGISFALREGESLGIIGPNGSGKTTLFNVLSGVFRPSRGQVRYSGRDVTGWPPHRIARLGLARTFQIPAVFRKMTVRENFLVAGGDVNDPAMRGRADELLEWLRLSHLAGEPAEVLSGGQQRLLELGRALMRRPRLILLDEVAAGVNPVLTRQIVGYVAELHRQGTALLVIEHDMTVIRGLSQRVIALDRGRPVAEGTFEQVKADPRVVEAYLGGESA